ncbi:MAG TPA: NAD+ synthase [Zoogloea sp.]|jgi:NAD+ synthase/NAD+ synthase (glutamine-hydrolysing)|uniref:NAD+ synthase n=1 Tax=Zoogloea sp. TaxID=49181 RepID=UPI002C70B7C5|nr:NAD+ synthase [Zoogloea sp.]HOB47409.1 NAD+ synthase [Zoogloea sp.]HQA12105.1 NAD+ synthase [Zoogloea sp.]
MKTPLTVAVAQLNCVVGDLSGNARRILDAVTQAKAAGADVVLTPELALCGYPPEDLLLRPAFLQACADELAALAVQVQGVTVLVGYPAVQGGSRYNAAAVIRDGRVIATYFKHRLPNYEVFDEERYFEPGLDACVFDLKGVKVGVNICADVWESGAAEVARNAGAELLLVLNASPFHMNKQQLRYEVMRERIADTGLPVVYCNLVGGQDELVFDGGSFALDGEGVLAWQGAMFAEELSILHFADGVWQERALPTARPEEADVYDALVLGVRDYLGKNGFPGALIGLSGGVDSALTLAIAVDALGADKVRAVMMPSPYTAQMSLDDSREMVRRIGVRYDEIAIAPAMKTFAEMLAPQFVGLPEDTTEENLQSRIRGMLLMALSNKTGAIVLTTGNKSEMATGYATLYGDMAGGFAVIKDIYKTFVYRLCAWRNAQPGGPVIPDNILTRPPSAELKPDQCDQDSLPPYEVLDAIIAAYMEEDLSPREMVARGYPETDVYRTVAMLKRNEYKRRQAPPGVRVTQRGFGKDWRYPITSRYRDA